MNAKCKVQNAELCPTLRTTSNDIPLLILAFLFERGVTK